MELHVVPRVSRTWDEFCATHPPRSIALDGYVLAPPDYAPAGPHANFDHHMGVDRVATRSTCMQVFLAVTLGLFEVFRKDDQPFAHIWVNDPDQDTCMAIWLLENHERVTNSDYEPWFGSLLLTEDLLDCTAGAYPVSPSRPIMRRQAWVFEPYFQARSDGTIPTMDESGMRTLIRAVCTRIGTAADGGGESIDLDTRHDIIGGGDGWRMIVEYGPHARTELFAAGVRAFVAVRDNGDASWTYSLGRMSPFVQFPILKLYKRLNREEGYPDGPQGWGGSNTIGGSPRQGGSRLPPADLERIINDEMGST